MADERPLKGLKTSLGEQGLLEDFSILELEDRLEFADCCDNQCGPANTNCPCPPPPPK